jgi:exodeoxyribonuclease V alpha subunit
MTPVAGANAARCEVQQSENRPQRAGTPREAEQTNVAKPLQLPENIERKKAMEATNIKGTIVDFKEVNSFFAVIKVQTEGNNDPIRIVGKPLHSMRKGMVIRANGNWQNSEKYGPQFQASTITESDAETRITGFIEEIIHYTPKTRYGIIRIKSDDKTLAADSKLITAVGEMTYPFVGNEILAKGQWETSKYGNQLKISTMTSIPRTKHAILTTLTHYNIPQEDANILYSHYGSNTISTLKYSPDDILSLAEQGVELSKLQNIYNAWTYHEHRSAIVQELSLYQLQQHAEAILNQFAHLTLEIIEKEPYRLMEIEGIGFKTADRVAKQIGISDRDPARIEAAILHIVGRELSGNGHSCAPYELVIEQCQRLIGQNRTNIEAALKRAVLNGIICLDKHDGVVMVYSLNNFQLEEETAQILYMIQQTPSKFTRNSKSIEWEDYLAILSSKNSVQLTDEQQGAVVNALKHKISILTGGPGTGKTTTLKMVINGLVEMGAHVTLASPTGKAAKRLSESSGREAKTIHRILGWNQETEDFQYNAETPLETEAVVIDEASMIDLQLFHSLIKALSPQAHIILVGDIYQLPSVGAGNVLRDLLESGRIPVTQLSKIFRQAETSKIVVNAYRINRGEALDVSKDAEDFFLFRIPENEIPTMIAEIIMKRLERVYGPFNPNTDVQVLAPMKKGNCGINFINQILQDAINPASANKASFKRGQQREFREGDKVIQLKNDYEKEVFNGDQGIISIIDNQKQSLSVQIEDRLVEYSFNEVYDSLMHAYCISTHRSQGSEYPVVIMPVSMEHGIMLQRNLLYTGVTRARKMIILVGSQDAIDKSIKTTSNTDRYSGLRQHLQRI